MAGEAVQLGVEYLIGVGETIYAGHCVQSVSYKTDADSTAHKCATGATDSILTQDPKKIFDVVMDIQGLTTDFIPPAKDSLISMKGPDDEYATGWRVVDAGTDGDLGVARLSMSLIAEDSMSALFDNGTVTKASDWEISEANDHNEILLKAGANDVVAVYGDGVLMLESTDWSYTDSGNKLLIESSYIVPLIVNPTDDIEFKILTNYGAVLTLTLTGVA